MTEHLWPITPHQRWNSWPHEPHRGPHHRQLSPCLVSCTVTGCFIEKFKKFFRATTIGGVSAVASHFWKIRYGDVEEARSLLRIESIASLQRVASVGSIYRLILPADAVAWGRCHAWSSTRRAGKYYGGAMANRKWCRSIGNGCDDAPFQVLCQEFSTPMWCVYDFMLHCNSAFMRVSLDASSWTIWCKFHISLVYFDSFNSLLAWLEHI